MTFPARRQLGSHRTERNDNVSVTLERLTSTALLQRLALDITRQCQAQCTHCYNSSGPEGEQGEMTRADWLALLDEGAALGVRQVQFIGGEPTLHPDLGQLINRAVDHGFAVEVFTNLILVPKALWPVLRQRGVTLATSYYSDQAEEHEAITKRRGSYRKTRANIAKAIRYSIPVRGAVIDVREGQRVEQAIAELSEMGVTHVGTDRVRGIGRSAGTDDTHQLAELCGYCARGRAAVMPNGEVAGCVMSGGMMTAGNVLTAPLAEIVASPGWAALAAAIQQPPGVAHDVCQPDPCVPEYACLPAGCSPDEDGCTPHIPEPDPVPSSASPIGAMNGACSPETCTPADNCQPSAASLSELSVTDACVPDSCTPGEDSCQPSPGATPVRALAGAGRTLRMGDGCVPDEDSCQPSPGIGPVGVLDRQATRTTAACNPDQDGSDCAPAETEACGPSY